MVAPSEHEARVAQFFALCEQSDPEHYREVCERHIVLSSDQMKSRTRREIAGSQLGNADARREFHRTLYSDSGTTAQDLEGVQ